MERATPPTIIRLSPDSRTKTQSRRKRTKVALKTPAVTQIPISHKQKRPNRAKPKRTKSKQPKKNALVASSATKA